MKSMSPRATVAVFTELLVKGQQVDWKYSLVMILVITGMFSTPLALGSIRNRVYAAVKEQIEKENNAREISLLVASGDAPRLDERVVKDLMHRFPELQVVGNHKLVISVEGPEGADFLTLQTLAPGDPRSDWLRIVPELPIDFGLTDLVLSDTLGRLLYGSDWDDLWAGGEFLGPPLSLRVNDLEITTDFTVVARRTAPGRGLYGSQDLGSALRGYTSGFGAIELGLPTDPQLVEHALPRLATAGCVVLLDERDPTCDAERRGQLSRRLLELQYRVESGPTRRLPAITGYRVLGFALGEAVDEGAQTVRREIEGDCRALLAPHLVDRCGSAVVLPDLAVELTLERASGEARTVTVAAVTRDVRRLLSGARQPVERHGTTPPSADSLPGLTVATASGLELAEEVNLRLAGDWLPARIDGFYSCPEGNPCPAFADPMTTFRLHNLQQGAVEIFSRDPLIFIPAHRGTEYDEVLAYVPEVEQVEAVSEVLRGLLPGISVQYNLAALDKLRRQDSRLSALFNVTIVLSALFIVLALGALALINVERRRRQVAQMLILGFSRRFVGRLIVAEYLLLTTLSSLASLGLTALLCGAARRFLSAAAGGTERGFEVIVQSMSVDGSAFLQVFAVVALCTWLIAQVTARRATGADPLHLLE